MRIIKIFGKLMPVFIFDHHLNHYHPHVMKIPIHVHNRKRIILMMNFKMKSRINFCFSFFFSDRDDAFLCFHCCLYLFSSLTLMNNLSMRNKCKLILFFFLSWSIILILKIMNQKQKSCYSFESYQQNRNDMSSFSAYKI
jgi:hypothetical protein